MWLDVGRKPPVNHFTKSEILSVWVGVPDAILSGGKSNVACWKIQQAKFDDFPSYKHITLW